VSRYRSIRSRFSRETQDWRTFPASPPAWQGAELSQLAGQASPWIAAAVTGQGDIPEYTPIPLGPPYKCAVFDKGYSGDCAGRNEIIALIDRLLPWIGEYLGTRSTRSFEVLVRNLRPWAAANAPAIDPDSADSANVHGLMIDVATELLMLWPTFRDDPALSSTDRELIENWLNRLIALPGTPDFFSFPNDLGEWGAQVAMADGIRRSDHAAFAFGIQRF
jgi:hypothetical protein